MKRKTSMAKGLPDIVPIVLGIMKDQRISKTQLAKKCGWAPSTITCLFKKRDWKSSELKQVGAVLKTNLFVYYLDTPIDGMVPASAVEETTKELLEVKAALKTKETELLVLQARYDLLKELRDNKG